MIRRLSLSLLAAGCMIATASAAPMQTQAAPEKPAVADATHVMTGRSAWHRHYWHRNWHPHYWHRWHHRH